MKISEEEDTSSDQTQKQLQNRFKDLKNRPQTFKKELLPEKFDITNPQTEDYKNQNLADLKSDSNLKNYQIQRHLVLPVFKRNFSESKINAIKRKSLSDEPENLDDREEYSFSLAGNIQLKEAKVKSKTDNSELYDEDLSGQEGRNHESEKKLTKKRTKRVQTETEGVFAFSSRMIEQEPFSVDLKPENSKQLALVGEDALLGMLIFNSDLNKFETVFRIEI